MTDYPSFTGWELCAQVGPMWFERDDRPASENDGSFYRAARAVCGQCRLDDPVIHDACGEWAVRHEQHGFWGGMSPNERAVLRAERGIALVDPSPSYWELFGVTAPSDAAATIVCTSEQESA